MSDVDSDSPETALARGPLPIVTDRKITAVRAEQDELYAAALAHHLKVLSIPVEDREAWEESRGPAQAQTKKSHDATSEASGQAPASLKTLARSICVDCFCFQPSCNVDGGEPSCRHAELRLESRGWVTELVALFHREDQQWQATIVAPWCALLRHIARFGTARERFEQKWELERVREIVEREHREAAQGRQVDAFVTGSPQAARIRPHVH